MNLQINSENLWRCSNEGCPQAGRIVEVDQPFATPGEIGFPLTPVCGCGCQMGRAWIARVTYHVAGVENFAAAAATPSDAQVGADPRCSTVPLHGSRAHLVVTERPFQIGVGNGNDTVMLCERDALKVRTLLSS